MDDTQAAASGAQRRFSLRKRVAVLLAAITVPAMAAPGDFGSLAGAAPTEAESVNAELAAQLSQAPAMPFERPGMSFPGSAFYYLADPPNAALVAIPTVDATDIGADAGRVLGAIIDAGPSARPFFSSSGTSHLRALDCLAQAVWYEAASEGEAGQRAVAQVVLNRVAHPSWPASVCGVVYQGSSRSTGCQFTFTCDGSLARRASGATWTRARRIADEALSGSVYAPIGHATHYHTLWINPYWASSLDHVGTIGAHRFYRNRGAGGQKGAFTNTYAGAEPTVSGRTRPLPAGSQMPGSPQTRPLIGYASLSGMTPTAPASATRPRYSAPVSSASASSAPDSWDPTSPEFTGAGQVREDYARAGQWKSGAAREALETGANAPASGNAAARSARAIRQ
jgi:hypothetical protein